MEFHIYLKMNKVVSPRQRHIHARKAKLKVFSKFPEGPRRPLDRTQNKPIPTLHLSHVSSPKHRSPVGSSTRETSRTRR